MFDDAVTFLNARPRRLRLRGGDACPGALRRRPAATRWWALPIRASQWAARLDHRSAEHGPISLPAPYVRWADYTHRQGYTIESLRATTAHSRFSDSRKLRCGTRDRIARSVRGATPRSAAPMRLPGRCSKPTTRRVRHRGRTCDRHRRRTSCVVRRYKGMTATASNAHCGGD